MNKVDLEEAFIFKKECPVLFIASSYHRTHKNLPITFENYQYMLPIYKDKSDYIVIEKSVQVGITEYLVINSIVQSQQGRSIFYVLPTFDLRNSFVNNRVNRSLEYTSYYKLLLQNEEGQIAESLSLKHIGNGSIKFVGSNSTAAFTEYPADTVIIDELDQCDMTGVVMSDERLKNSERKMRIRVSNPTFNGFGIDEEYNKSDKKQWFIKCECGEGISPDFFINVVREIEPQQYILMDEEYDWEMSRDINLICHKCGRALNRYQDGKWRPAGKSYISGYHISQLFSTTTKISELVREFNEGLKNDTKMQRFYNGSLGLPYTSSGAKITFDNLNACIREYNMPDKSDKICIMGMDVGSGLHTVICEILPDGILRTVFIGKLNEENEIYELIQKFNVKFGCVDGLPETHMVRRIVGRLRGFFKVFFVHGKYDSINVEKKIINADRTASLDSVRELIETQNIIFPQNIGTFLPIGPNGRSEFYNQMTAAVRVWDEQRKVFNWIKGNDHYMFAVNYLLIAKKLALKAGINI